MNNYWLFQHHSLALSTLDSRTFFIDAVIQVVSAFFPPPFPSFRSETRKWSFTLIGGRCYDVIVAALCLESNLRYGVVLFHWLLEGPITVQWNLVRKEQKTRNRRKPALALLTRKQRHLFPPCETNAPIYFTQYFLKWVIYASKITSVPPSLVWKIAGEQTHGASSYSFETSGHDAACVCT